MRRGLLMNEFHVTVFVPRGLPHDEYQKIHRTLNGAAFRRELKHAAQEIKRRYPSLKKTTIVVSQ